MKKTISEVEHEINVANSDSPNIKNQTMAELFNRLKKFKLG
jgi:hypothetical protein